MSQPNKDNPTCPPSLQVTTTPLPKLYVGLYVPTSSGWQLIATFEPNAVSYARQLQELAGENFEVRVSLTPNFKKTIPLSGDLDE